MASDCPNPEIYSFVRFFLNFKRVVIELNLESLPRRAVLTLSAAIICAALLLVALLNVAVGLLTDPRGNVTKELLESGNRFVSNSAPLSARLAEVEFAEPDRDIQKVEDLAKRAVNISPWDYRQRLLLARVEEARGDRAYAEQMLQKAVELAPNYSDVHWRLANLFLREGKLSRAVPEFRTAISASPEMLPGALDILWRVSGGNIIPVQAVSPRDAKSQLMLAQFLLKQSRPSDAITIISGIDRNVLAGMTDISSFVDSLMASGRIEEARGLWVGLISGAYAQPGRPLPTIWNPGFESDISKSLAQFDWNISRSDYANLGIDSNAAHSGARSLRIDFTGRDTSKLDGQLKQTVVVRPGTRYRLECYVKTDRFESPEGPRLVITDLSSSTELGGSEPIASGSNDWRLMTFDFAVPGSYRAVVVSIRRIPKFSFDQPTRGTIWLDDFVLSERAQ